MLLLIKLMNNQDAETVLMKGLTSLVEAHVFCFVCEHFLNSAELKKERK